MKAASVLLANPNYVPSMAALFHSTPLLSFKKRTYWPEKSYCRGPPRPRYKLVFKYSEVTVIDNLFDENPTSWYWRADEGGKTQQDSSQHSGNYSSSSSKSSSNKDIMTSDRLALGLTATGPINLEDIKIAYPSCAMKWHPDHHQGFSKTFAEEKFKSCSAAYRSLCNKLGSS